MASSVQPRRVMHARPAPDSSQYHARPRGHVLLLLWPCLLALVTCAGNVQVRAPHRWIGARAAAAPSTVADARAPSPHSPDARLLPWPDGKVAAISLSFDWETAMGGIDHTRSGETTPQQVQRRARAMRDGAEWLLSLLKREQLRATWFANGYNFLWGNTAHERFMGDPVFAWATPDRGFADRWAARPWFSDDPYGSVATHPEWYFGDMTARLARSAQAVECHTFSHLDIALASEEEVRSDLVAWNEVAARRGLGPTRALACPWGCSGPVADATWQAISDAGIAAVTRAARNAPFGEGCLDRLEPQPHPALASLLLFPDLYVATQSEGEADRWIERVVARGGAVDLWTHPADLVAANREVWSRLIATVARRDDLWVAPLSEIAARWLATRDIHVSVETRGASVEAVVENRGDVGLTGLAIELPARVLRAQPAADARWQVHDGRLVVDAPPHSRATGRVTLARQTSPVSKMAAAVRR